MLKKIKLKKYKYPYISKKWINWLNDKEVTKFSDQRFKTHNLYSQKKYINSLRQQNTVFFKIYLEKLEIGNIILSYIDNINKNCTIAFLIGEKSLWNKGIGTYVVKLTINYAFNKLKMKKIYSWCHENNIGCRKALIKNQFKIEGTMKKFYKSNSTIRHEKIYFGLYQDNK